MFYGARSCAPLGVGFAFGLIFWILFSRTTVLPLLESSIHGYSFCRLPVKRGTREYVDQAEKWTVHVSNVPQSRLSPEEINEDLKIFRSRFAATELGIKGRLLVIVFGQSSLSVALNASLGQHVTRIHLFAEESRIDVDMSTLAENLTPYRPNGQHAHVHVLNTIFNKSMHENYDWYLFLPDTTYVNPFKLMEFIKNKNFQSPIIYGISDSIDKCSLNGGILMSNSILLSLVQQRHVCSSIVAPSDEKAFETCILHATNKTCTKDPEYTWWKSEDGVTAIHDKIKLFSLMSKFNRSMTVSKLLSDADVTALHDHFISVEQQKLNRELERLAADLDPATKDVPMSQTWPQAMPPVLRPPNRYQVNNWEYFTETEIFKIEPHQNFYHLSGNDQVDIQDIVNKAKQMIQSKSFNIEFIRLRSGYRSFNALRGMEYILDFEYQEYDSESLISKRIILCRPIENTQLVPHVPYVKEDTDITLVIPIGSIEDVIPTRALLVRHLRMCKSTLSQIDTRRMRLVIAVRGINAVNVRRIGNDLNVLKERCKSMQTETSLLLLKPNIDLIVEMAAMDEAIDHYGQQTVYVLLSPYADYQREFLDRVRINSIRRFQVFMPIPFAEYSPKITAANHAIIENEVDDKSSSFYERMRKMNENVTPADSLNPIKVHKDYGIFDSSDFSVISMYGVDYINMRSRLLQRIIDGELVLDLSLMFIGQSDIHILRAIEPNLKMRYHPRTCPNLLSNMDFIKCTSSQKQTLGSKPQLANVIFNDLEDASVFQ